MNFFFSLCFSSSSLIVIFWLCSHSYTFSLYWELESPDALSGVGVGGSDLLLSMQVFRISTWVPQGGPLSPKSLIPSQGLFITRRPLHLLTNCRIMQSPPLLSNPSQTDGWNKANGPAKHPPWCVLAHSLVRNVHQASMLPTLCLV